MPARNRLRVLPDDLEIGALPGDTALAAARRAGLPHLHLCGGHAHCSTCRVDVRDGADHCVPRTRAERQLAHRLQAQPAAASDAAASMPLRCRRGSA